jgi:hypothetical protein
MSISVTPILPALAVQNAAPDLVLQPGSVIDAQVLQVLAENMVRIAIANVSIDVLSEVPLAAGQALQLAVSQTPDGVRLAVVGQGAPAAASGDLVTLTSGAIADAVAPSAIAAPARNILTPLERVAVSVAAADAAGVQDSLAPLFANLGAVAGSSGLPPKLQQAVMQVLAQQTSLDQNLTGSAVQNAFQKSGILLEASLASGSISQPTGMPDLKAALIVLRQVLVASLGPAGMAEPAAASAAAAPAMAAPGAAPVFNAGPGAPQPAAASSPALTPSPTLAPSLAPETELQEVLQAQTRVIDDPVQPGGTARIVLPEALLNAGPRSLTAGAALNLLQETLQQTLQPMPRIVGNGALPAAMPRNGRGDDVTFHTNTPPPPFRGALPSAQPVAAPSIAPNAPLSATAHHLLADTDAAIARQTLLQVASLPDRVDTTGPRVDPNVPRWNFEIPFLTPQGTAMAQFEISRDGGGNEVEAAKRVWRARFSLDVEPAGPVHALVSLVGDKTSVRMWAERPATAAQLRAGAAQLSQALSKAELHPGDIVIREGAPPQPAPARAGHFLDRAL